MANLDMKMAGMSVLIGRFDIIFGLFKSLEMNLKTHLNGLCGDSRKRYKVFI
jgi:hypothetical protein